MVAVTARGHPADDLAVVPDGLVADDVGRVVRVGLDDEGHQSPSRPAGRDLGLVSGPSDELMIELDVVGDPALERGVDRPVFAEPRPVALLEPQRHEGAHPEQPDPVLGAGFHDPVEQRRLVFGRHPQLVAEVARVVDPADQRRDHPEVDPPEVHEPERLGRQVRGGDRGQHVARPRAGDRQARQRQAEDLEPDAPVGRQVMAEPARVVDLRRQRPEQVERGRLVGPCDGELADDPAGVVEHRRQRDPSDLRHPGCEERRQPGLRTGPGDPVLGVVGDLRHPDPFADGGHLLGHLRPGVRAPERDVLDRRQPLRLEPQRMLQAERRTPDRVGRGQPVVDRRRQQRPGRRQLLVREGDPEAPPVILLDLRVRVGEGGVVAVAGDVHAPDIHPQIAVVAGGHPGRQRQPDPAALRQPGHHAAGDPEAAQPADRADQWVPVGRERERPVDHALDAGRAHRRVVPECDLELGRDPVEVGLEQLRPEVPWRLARRPRHARLLIRPEQHRAALLADVDLAPEVERHRHLVAGARDMGRDLGHVLGQQVDVLHGQDRQLQPDHPADLARPQTAGVDDVLGMDPVAALEDDVPGPVRPLLEAVHLRVEPDLRTGQLCALDIRPGHPGRVDVALDRVVQRPDEVLRVEQREEVARLGGRDELEVHAQVATARDGHPQEVHPDLRVGEHQPTRQVDRAVLAGDPLDLLVQLDRVLLELGDVRVTVEGVHPAGRVPGRTGGELETLEQHHVGPAGLRQVIEHAGAHHAPTDDDDLGRCLHQDPLRDDRCRLNSRSGRRPRRPGGRRTPPAPRRWPGPSAAAHTRPAAPSRSGSPSMAAPVSRPPATSRSCASR